MSTLISTTHLQRMLPSGASDTNGELTAAVNAATSFVNTHAVKYVPFDNIDNNGNTQAPAVIVMYAKMIAKAYYFMGVGQVYRDGNEDAKWQDLLNDYRNELRDIDIPPQVYSKTISLDSDGHMLIARNMHVLRFHPDCRVESVASPANDWNQLEHWDIRLGGVEDDEFEDGWYFDAETYKDSIEGTLYYVRSFRNDYLDYQRYMRFFEA